MGGMLRTNAKRKRFGIIREARELKMLMDTLPEKEVYKFISDGGFSSIAFIDFVAEKVKIDHLTASTLRIGKKHLRRLDMLHQDGRLEQAHFIVGGIMRDDSDRGKTYGYYDNLEVVCNNNNWTFEVQNNHSKIILMDTAQGKFVLETSSNLNENPKIEQFSFEQDRNLYDFYIRALSG